jgi:glycosyltransferase involved in cell wall biosynthesis
MMIIVAYPSLNSVGGGQRLCLHVIKALKKRGFKVCVATLDKTNWNLYSRVFGESFKPDCEFYLFSRMPKLPTLTLRQGFVALFYALELLLISFRKRRDLLVNMGGEVLDSIGDIVYVNAVPLRLMHVYSDIQPKPGALWKCYSRLYSFLVKVLKIRGNVVVCNSRFNQRIVRKHLGLKSIVVYPPVNVREIGLMVKNAVRREDLVVTVSRFRLAKRLEMVPEIAKCVGKGRFLIIGSADVDSVDCIVKVGEEARKLGVEERVHMLLNKPFSVVLENLVRAKVYLHTQPTEAFGMSVVEAMAAGCVPVVPRCGGPWFDILDCKQGVYGFSYRSVGEAAEIIGRLLEDDVLRESVAAKAREHARVFDSSIFEGKILDLVDKVFRAKFG